jgi:hypothetical protein
MNIYAILYSPEFSYTNSYEDDIYQEIIHDNCYSLMAGITAKTSKLLIFVICIRIIYYYIEAFILNE